MELFCSPEHRELHLNREASEALERLRETLAWEAQRDLEPDKSAVVPFKAKPAPPRVKWEQPQAQPMAEPQPPSVVEPQPQSAVESQLAQLQAKEATQETSLTLEIASLGEAVETSKGMDLPEAPVLHELPSPQNQPAYPLQSYAAVPISAAVQMPVSPAPKPLLQTSPSLEIASLGESVGTSKGIDLPEAPVLHELPAPRNQPASPLQSFAAVPISAAVKLPISPAPKPLLQTSPSLVLDVSPAQSPLEVTPVASQATWRPVPQGYPPVVVSASATLVLDANGADLIPLRMGEPCRGGGPPPPPQSAAIEPRSRPPQLPSRQVKHRSAWEVSALFAPPPQAPACDPAWGDRQGSGPALPQLAGILLPRRDVVRMAPSARQENFGALSSFPFFAAAPDRPLVPANELFAAPPEHVPAAISLRRTLSTGKAPSTSQALALVRAPRPLAIDSTTPLHCEPPAGEVDSEWLQMAVASQLPRAGTVLAQAAIGLCQAADSVPLGWSSAAHFPPAVDSTTPAWLQTAVAELPRGATVLLSPAIGLSLAADSVPLGWSSAASLRCEPPAGEVDSEWLQMDVASQLPRADTVLLSPAIGLSLAADSVSLGCSSAAHVPPAVETAGAVSSAIPFVLLSRTWSLAPPAMQWWSSTRPVWREACRLPVPVSEQQGEGSVAHFHPSHPSPMSLVTWSHSLSISIPACKPSNLGRPAPIGISANPGRTHALLPWSPSRRGHRLTPLLPEPNGVTWAPDAPMQAALKPPVIKPIRPGRQGTAPPSLVTVRVQPAAMPMLPSASAHFGIELGTGLAVSGRSSEDALKLACVDMAHGTSRMARELRAESSAVLPSFLARRPVPPIGLAPCTHRLWWCALPPVQTVNLVQPFSALKRLSWSVTASLPGASPTGLTERLGLTPVRPR
jgi:hypothetical protein